MTAATSGAAGRAAVPPSERVGIVMLTWNALDFTKRALASLQEETTYPDLDVVVVDNGSTDGTVEWLRSVPGIRVIANGRNLGFTGGVNVGLAALDGDADAILLNNDLLVTQPDWIERLRDCAYSAPDIGIVGCRLVDADARLQHAGSYVTPVGMRGEQIGGELDVGQYTDRREVECAVGAVLYIKRAVLDVTGGLHREYFSYFEDTDLCYEAAAAGFRTMYAGDVTLVHHQNVSTRENRVDIWEMFDRSHGIFMRRWADTVRNRYSPTVEVRAPFGDARRSPSADADAAIDLVLALHDAGVAVVPRLTDGGVPDFDHPLLADVAAREVPHQAVRLVLAPERAPGDGVRAVLMAGSAPLEPECQDLSGFETVWVASEHAQSRWKAAGVTLPIEVVPFGIDPAYFHPGARRFRSRNDFVVGTACDRDGRADPVGLLRAFNARFGRADPVVLHCHVRSGTEVEAAVGSAGLREEGGRVVVTTRADVVRSERCALYGSWDACVVLERDPASPVAVLEPMAVGLPTVAIAEGATAEIIDEACGWPVASDSGAVIEAIATIMADPAGAAARAAEGATRAAPHTWSKAAARVRDLLERMEAP